MKIGYARVSTDGQSLESQIDALRAAHCDRVYEEVASGARNDRKVLSEVLDYLRPGDVLVAYKLDRIARSLPHLIEIMGRFSEAEIGFQSLTEDINTATPGGRLVFHVMAALAEFERDLIRERTAAGLQAARAKGRVGGRPRKMTPDKIDAARDLLASGKAVKDVAQMFGISVPTLYRWCPGATR